MCGDFFIKTSAEEGTTHILIDGSHAYVSHKNYGGQIPKLWKLLPIQYMRVTHWCAHARKTSPNLNNMYDNLSKNP